MEGPGVRVMNDDDALSPQVGRCGEHVRGGGVSFRCAACGEMAAVVRLVRAGTTVNMGPPLGEQAYDRDGVVVDFWLGSTCWRRLDPARWARIEQVLASLTPRGFIRSTGNWRPTGAAIAGVVTAAVTGSRRSSGMGRSTTTPTAYARPGTAT
jgi:hypothetical protein